MGFLAFFSSKEIARNFADRSCCVALAVLATADLKFSPPILPKRTASAMYPQMANGGCCTVASHGPQMANGGRASHGGGRPRGSKNKAPRRCLKCVKAGRVPECYSCPGRAARRPCPHQG
jgi:hypothetical protein